MGRIIATALILACATLPARANFKAPNTVQDFVTACEQSNVRMPGVAGAMNFTYCAGMVTGILATLSLNDDESSLYRACNVKGVTPGQLIQAFLNWARANPKHWQSYAPLAMMAVFIKTWPCKP